MGIRYLREAYLLKIPHVHRGEAVEAKGLEARAVRV